MKVAALPCAIYTRKSSEEGLEQDFNSLDAQREACAAYIQSQKALGWRALGSYDDGGFSGGTLERPALQRLLADIEAGKVRVVVVYKVDRLTRSLADFAKMVERFDAHGVSFVSVTQQFNTTSSMGRLTLNVLLSFAQFEREVTGERIRDKIAASKRKGMWLGGNAPVGYVARERTLAIDEPQAQRIREIYALYLKLNCVRLLKAEVDCRGWVTPPRPTRRPNGGGNRPFSRGHLYRILGNAVYAGKIVHKGEVFPGNHPAIVDPALWQAVQERLAANRQGVRKNVNVQQPSLLAGLVFAGDGTRLTATHTQKQARRYRYYVTPPAADGTGSSESPLRVPAQELEELVVSSAIGWLRDASQIVSHLGNMDARAMQSALRDARILADQIEAAPDECLPRLIERVVLLPDKITLAIRLEAIGIAQAAEEAAPARATLEIPAKLKRSGTAVRLIVPGPGGEVRRSADPKLVALLAKAQDWLGRLTSGTSTSITAIAQDAGVGPWYVTRVMYLGVLAPDIVQRIVRGDYPAAITADSLMRMTPLPCHWQSQRSLLGLD